jgi:DNA polymerase-3 subunit epsilon
VPDVTVPAPPPRRLRRGSWREAAFASLDFETTGLNLDHDAVVSFGVVPVLGGRVVVGEGVHQLVAPDVPSTPVSMKIHRILPRDVAEAPALEGVRDGLATALAGRYLLAWYAGVELAFLRRIFGGRRRAWRRRTVDVRDLAIAVEGADPDVRFGLSTTAERYGVPVANPHEAFDDALVTAQLFLVLAARLEAGGRGTVRDLVRLTSA